MSDILPESVQIALDSFVNAARDAFGDDLRSIVLFGSAAEGRMRATSDVNVIVVLRRFDHERVDRFREPYRSAAAALDLEAMFLLESEIDEASREFAQKFADVARRRRVLFGDDPFAELAISRDALLRRTKQVLLNLTLRLRAMYVERSLREEQAALVVADSTGPLRVAAASILELEGRGVLTPKEALETLVRDLGRPELSELLPHLSEAREQRALPAGRAAELLFTMIELARTLSDRAYALQ
ncbi:MAG TPA: nucleotidyltransferase domain-containing protein [Thermoanaerobaculia bacterium]|nr:nucleotidyltransferase domain-containing protein [Thermoanaerobaculia bacterium]